MKKDKHKNEKQADMWMINWPKKTYRKQMKGIQPHW